MALTRASLRSPLWVWAKVGACLAVLDVLLFRWTWLWWAMPVLPQANPTTWGLLYEATRRLESPPGPNPETFLVGSSVLYLGVYPPGVEAALRERGIQTDVRQLSTFGASATDAALLAWQTIPRRPWLVVYAVASRDFDRKGQLDTPVARLFADASQDVPALAPTNVDTWLDRWVKRGWKLYRYRYFVRRGLVEVGNAFLPPRWRVTLEPAPAVAPAAAPPAAAPVLSAEARARFHYTRITPQSYAVWEHWRETRRFEDFVAWMEASGNPALKQYATETLERYGPDDNPQVASLDWTLRRLHEAHVRVVVAFFPENPAFRAPGGERYYDRALSDANAAAFAREAAQHGARFVDLRDVLDAEDFYDLIHPNLVGGRKLTARVTEIVAEEARASAPARSGS